MSIKTVLAEGFTALGGEAISRRLFRKGRSALFHRVAETGDPLWPPLRPDTFRAAVRYMARNYEVVALRDVNTPSQTGKPRIAVSFDDGFADFYHTAWPILKEEGIARVNHNFITHSLETGLPPWTCVLHAYLHRLASEGASFEFGEPNTMHALQIKINKNDIHHQYETIYSALQKAPFIALRTWIRETLMPEAEHLELPPMMNKAMLTELHRDGLEVGAHGKEHLMLNNFDCIEDIEEEVLGSKRVLESILGTIIDTYALPNGISNARACEFIAKNGFSRILFAGLPVPVDTDFSDVEKVVRTSVHHQQPAPNAVRLALHMR